MLSARAFSTAAHAASREFKTVGVLGLGLMGSGIAQVTAAAAGRHVIGVESTPELATRAFDGIAKSLKAAASKAVAKGAKTESAAAADVDATLSRLTFVADRGALARADVVIEAAPEDAAFKAKLYADLRGIVRADAVVASNTSGLLISDLAKAFGDDTRVIGLHYFNPVPMMGLCEVIVPSTVSAGIREAAIALVEAQKKTPVLAADTPGFVVNRLLVPFLASAISLVERKVATVADVDAAMKLGCGHPMGPLTLADYVGLDTTLFILKNWTRQFPRDADFRVPPLLEKLVAAGRLGRKSGEKGGFYAWDGNKVGSALPLP
jgi:3-hydroxyacyl-CoA dehydrogenase